MKGFIVVTVYQILLRLLNHEDKMCEPCSTQERHENAYKLQWENPNGRDHLEDKGL
jgi:hypothetical protein